MKKLLLLALMISVSNLWAQTADQIVQNYIQKIGGQKLDQVHSLIQKGTMNINGMDFPTESYQDTSGKIYSKLNMMGQDIVAIAFDGNKGYKFNGGTFGYEDIPDSLTTQIKQKAQNMFGFFYKYKEHGRQIKYLGKQKFDDIQTDAIQMTFNKPLEGGIKDIIAYFNPETGLIMGIKVVKDGHIIITRPDNYKAFDGILIPTKLVNEMDGNVFQTIKIETVQINPPAPDPAIFEKPKQ